MTEDRGQRAPAGGLDSTPIRGFRDLAVFQKAYGLSLQVHRFSLTLPRIEQFGLAEQMRRASRSICATIAEGHGRAIASPAEFRRYLTMAVGSADEMQLWTDYVRDLGYAEPDLSEELASGYAELARMLQGLRKNWR